MPCKHSNVVILLTLGSLASALIGYLCAYVLIERDCVDRVPARQSIQQLVLASDAIVVAEVTGEDHFGPQKEVFVSVCSQSLTVAYTIRILDVIRGDDKKVGASKRLLAEECIDGPNEIGRIRLLVGKNYLLFLDREASRPIFPMSRYAVPVGHSAQSLARKESNREVFHIAAWIMSQNPDTPERSIVASEVYEFLYQSEWDVLLRQQLELIPAVDRRNYCEYLEGQLGLFAVEKACSMSRKIEDGKIDLGSGAAALPGDWCPARSEAGPAELARDSIGRTSKLSEIAMSPFVAFKHRPVNLTGEGVVTNFILSRIGTQCRDG